MHVTVYIRFWFATASLCSCLACTPALHIRIKTDQIPAGYTAVYRETSSTVTQLTLPDGHVETESAQMIREFAYQLIAAEPDGAGRWQRVLLRQRSEKLTDGKIHLLDTDLLKNDTNPLSAAFVKHYLQTPLRFRMQNNGVVSELNPAGVFEYDDRLDAQEKKLAAALQEQLNDGAMQRSVHEFWAFYPPHALKKSKKWRHSGAFPLCACRQNAIYHLNGVRDTVYLIEGEKEIFSVGNEGAPDIKIGAATFFYHLKGHSSDRLEVRQSDGLLGKASQAIELSGRIDVQAPPTAVHSFPVSIKTLVETERIR